MLSLLRSYSSLLFRLTFGSENRSAWPRGDLWVVAWNLVWYWLLETFCFAAYVYSEEAAADYSRSSEWLSPAIELLSWLEYVESAFTSTSASLGMACVIKGLRCFYCSRTAIVRWILTTLFIQISLSKLSSFYETLLL